MTDSRLYRNDTGEISIFIRSGKSRKSSMPFIQGGININAGSNLKLSLTAFQRTVKNAIIFQPAVTMYGSSAISHFRMSMKLNHWDSTEGYYFTGHHFEALGVMTLTAV